MAVKLFACSEVKATRAWPIHLIRLRADAESEVPILGILDGASAMTSLRHR
jgi:hypothetical protein